MSVSVDGSDLLITEVGIGTAQILVNASDGNGGEVEVSFEVTVNEALGLENQVEYKVYPNPTSDILSIEGEYDRINWQLIEVTGKILDSDVLERGESIDVSNYASGIYYLRINDYDKIMKVIIRNR